MATEIEAPERIWIGERAKFLHEEEGASLCFSRPEIGGVEYIRADLLAAAIAGEPDPDELDIDYYLEFCDTCGVPAEHVLVEDEWQCCGPAHLVIQNKNSG